MNVVLSLMLCTLLTTVTLAWAFWPRKATRQPEVTYDRTDTHDRTAAAILLHAARRERQLAALERRLERQADDRLRTINRDWREWE